MYCPLSGTVYCTLQYKYSLNCTRKPRGDVVGLSPVGIRSMATLQHASCCNGAENGVNFNMNFKTCITAFEVAIDFGSLVSCQSPFGLYSIQGAHSQLQVPTHHSTYHHCNFFLPTRKDCIIQSTDKSDSFCQYCKQWLVVVVVAVVVVVIVIVIVISRK
jgi:hypothetical protein